MKRAFCTIVTPNYLPFARTLYKSLVLFDNSLDFYVLVSTRDAFNNSDSFEVLNLTNLSNQPLVLEIEDKYKNNSDALRWSLKSVLMIHLLELNLYHQVFFSDPDLCFYNDFIFLYDNLGDSPILLSPHWGCMDPQVSETYFSRLRTDGIYNGGFLGATRSGLDVLYWWAKVCLYACKVDLSTGLYDDQRYLDLIPIICPDYSVITHRGCNVAEWNRHENVRSISSNGELIINGQYPIIFIHFSNLGYLVEHDPFLLPYLKEYEERLRSNGWTGNLVQAAYGYINRKHLRELSLWERGLRKVFGHKRFAKLNGWEIYE